MRLLLTLIFIFSLPLVGWTQNDPGVPTTNSGGGGGTKTINTDVKTVSELLVDYNLLILTFSKVWTECKGDPLGIYDFYSIGANLLAVYEAHQQVGMQPSTCEDCQKKADRYQCLKKSGIFIQMEEFVYQPNATKFVKTQYDLRFKRQAEKLLEPLKQVVSTPDKSGFKTDEPAKN